jgi:uncharacterized protein YjbK
MVENEFKYFLTVEKYNAIYCDLKNETLKSNHYIQINYYYDTQDHILNRNGITFRIRQKENDLKLQIKSPVSQKESLFVKNEIEKVVKRLPLRIDTNTLDIELPCTGNVNVIGSLVTERIECKYKDFIEIDLDKNFYLGTVDYELEIEFKGNYYKDVLQLVNDFVKQDNIVKSSQSKSKRFFSIFESLSGKNCKVD